jgi:hypothetical protein
MPERLLRKERCAQPFRRPARDFYQFASATCACDEAHCIFGQLEPLSNERNQSLIGSSLDRRRGQPDLHRRPMDPHNFALRCSWLDINFQLASDKFSDTHA